MNLELESNLLRLIDEVLSGTRIYDEFAAFRERISKEWLAAWDRAYPLMSVDVPPNLPPSCYAEEPLATALREAAEDMLPDGRYEFFPRIRERASWTTTTALSEQDRHDGWITLDESFELLTAAREDYRRRFFV